MSEVLDLCGTPFCSQRSVVAVAYNYVCYIYIFRCMAPYAAVLSTCTADIDKAPVSATELGGMEESENKIESITHWVALRVIMLVNLEDEIV